MSRGVDTCLKDVRCTCSVLGWLQSVGLPPDLRSHQNIRQEASSESGSKLVAHIVSPTLKERDTNWTKGIRRIAGTPPTTLSNLLHVYLNLIARLGAPGFRHRETQLESGIYRVLSRW